MEKMENEGIENTADITNDDEKEIEEELEQKKMTPEEKAKISKEKFSMDNTGQVLTTNEVEEHLDGKDKE